MIKIAINGFGRIGRNCAKAILEKCPNLDLEAINDLTDTKTLAHLLKYDSIYGIYDKNVQGKEGIILINKKEIKISAEKDPLNLLWGKTGIDIVLECTGNFTELEDAKKHLAVGAKKVVISAPSKSEKIRTFVPGVNEENYDGKNDSIVSMASCTTNCLAPLAKVLNDNFKIERGFMTTVHSYTNDQRILDLPHKDFRRARAAAINIIPTSTGAASAIGKVIPELAGKLDGIAFRVPTPTVSVLDLVCQVEKKTTAEEVNFIIKKASQEKKMEGILGIEDALLVSSDYIGNSFSCIVDASLTMVNENLIKITAWYDNEWAYSCRLAEFADFMGKKM
ncbi:MAG: type I glyceraldehyde-3-phosphate dehydrogenase [Parcubacteria group bacterium]